MKILIADDDPLSSEIARRLVERLGFSVTPVPDGEEAVSRLVSAHRAGEGYDLAFLDISMPGLDGLEAARAIRKAGLTLPLVALSGGEPEDALSQAGIDRLIQKPYDLGDLKRVLAETLGWRPNAG